MNNTVLNMVYEKPMEHIEKSVFKERLKEIQDSVADRNAESFALRHSSRQMRYEGNVRAEWGTHHNNMRLSDRLAEVTSWHAVLDTCLQAVQKEIMSLKEEKAVTDRALETFVNTPLTVVSECITLRDGRRGNDLNQDDAYDELNREQEVVEAVKNMLSANNQESWEQLNRLTEIEFRLRLDLANKVAGMEIEKYNLEIDKNCSGASFKVDKPQSSTHCIAYEEWLTTSMTNKRRTDEEITNAIKLRERLTGARERAFNALQKQHDATNFVMRKQVYETQRARNEIEWQRSIMNEELEKITVELASLESELRDKVSRLKLCETRLENRSFRIGPELVCDPAQAGLGEEKAQLRKSVQELNNRIASTRALYNTLEDTLLQSDIDLDNKCHSLMTDLRVIDTRKRLLTMDRTPKGLGDIRFKLTRMVEEIPIS